MQQELQYPARILVRGYFRPEDIVLENIPLPEFPSQIQQEIDDNWARELKINPNLRNGPLLAGLKFDVESYHGLPTRIRLTCSASNYKNFMGTTREEFVHEDLRHRAIGIMAITKTRDGYLMLGVRSPRIDWGTLRHVIPAGRLRPNEDPYSGITAEYKEELGLIAEEIHGLQCIGVVCEESWGRLNYEFVFRANTSLTARQLTERAKTAKSAGEHSQLEPFPFRENFMRELLLADPNGFVPTGWAGLALCLIVRSWNFPEWTPCHRSYEEHMGRRLEMLRK